jgi:hypothetical protein
MTITITVIQYTLFRFVHVGYHTYCMSMLRNENLKSTRTLRWTSTSVKRAMTVPQTPDPLIVSGTLKHTVLTNCSQMLPQTL